MSQATSVPIAVSKRVDTGFAFLERSPIKLAEVAVALLFEKKLQAPCTIFLTEAETLIVGTQGLMSDIELYESRLRDICDKHTPYAAIQAVHAVLRSGDSPILHVRVETFNKKEGWNCYGAVIFSWGRRTDGTVAVSAASEQDYELGTPFIMKPRVVIPGLTAEA
jgi:hypothetical protein